jgi:hypothetical protein
MLIGAGKLSISYVGNTVALEARSENMSFLRSFSFPGIPLSLLSDRCHLAYYFSSHHLLCMTG